MTKGKRRGLLLYIIVLIALGIITELVPEVTGALTKTEILQYENMQITDEVTCYFVRKETVHLASNAGAINYYIEDGVKVRKNSKILDIAPQSLSSDTSKYADIITRLGSSDVTLTQMNSAQNGIVSYYVDGYEGYFTPEKMDSLKYKDIEGVKINPVNLTRKNTLAGEPLFKICEGNYWYMIAWVDPGNISKYEVGNSVKVDLPLGQIKANIDKLVDQGDHWLVIMKTTMYYEDFAKIRSANANIITQDYSGIKVRNSSMTTKDGVVGVYIKSKNGDFVFKPVKIITSDGDYSLVYVSNFYDKDGKEVKTVEIYDEILKNPKQDFKSSGDSKNSAETNG
nr:HlyD family efflux transporter periplasmic adaptor subunit [uncultured Aminipila sp.]